MIGLPSRNRKRSAWGVGRVEAKQYLEDMRGNEVMWEGEFAGRLMDKRRQVDRGESTIAELQIAYLQENSPLWGSKGAGPVKELNKIVDKTVTNSQASGANPLTALLAQMVAGFTVVAVVAFSITSRLASSLPTPREESSTIASP